MLIWILCFIPFLNSLRTNWQRTLIKILTVNTFEALTPNFYFTEKTILTDCKLHSWFC